MIAVQNTLNARVLPPDYYAPVEQRVSRPRWHVPVPLEPTYGSTWEAFPAPPRRLLEPAG